MPPAASHGRLARRLGLLDASVIGVGSMLGAGVFVAFGPAAAAAGQALGLALVLAGAVAWLNADSSARLAAVLPTSGGAYAYGRSRLRPAVGVVAGTAFLVGKTLSVAAVATAVGTYVWPERSRALAVAVVLVLTAAACAGARRGARLTLAVVVVVLLVLGAVVVLALTGAPAVADGAPGAADGEPGALGVLGAAGVLFFAFAGYARVATLGEEVRDPARTLPRAIAAALAVVLATYALVGLALVRTLGLERLAASERPVADAAALVGVPDGLVAGTAALAAAASCLGVLLALSRTTLAMARDAVLPGTLARLHGPADEPRPVVAQAVVGLAAAVAAALVDLRTAIALSSVCVLVYYAVAHAAALTLPGRARRVVPALGLAGCLLVAGAVAVGLPTLRA